MITARRRGKMLDVLYSHITWFTLATVLFWTAYASKFAMKPVMKMMIPGDDDLPEEDLSGKLHYKYFYLQLLLWILIILVCYVLCAIAHTAYLSNKVPQGAPNPFLDSSIWDIMTNFNVFFMKYLELSPQRGISYSVVFIVACMLLLMFVSDTRQIDVFAPLHAATATTEEDEDLVVSPQRRAPSAAAWLMIMTVVIPIVFRNHLIGSIQKIPEAPPTSIG
jgi:hypothetical protein